VTGNSALNGDKTGGQGGGIDIVSVAVVYLDAPTKKHTTGNTPDDINGSYTLTS
jgi:hypothetical protein